MVHQVVYSLQIGFLLRFLIAQIQNNVEYPAKLELPVACLSDELKTRLTSKQIAVSSFDHLLCRLRIFRPLARLFPF